MTWTLAQAKDQLSEVVRRAVDEGPQSISVRGRDAAVLLSRADYDRLTDPGAPTSLVQFLKTMNLEGVDLTRDQTPVRDLDF